VRTSITVLLCSFLFCLSALAIEPLPSGSDSRVAETGKPVSASSNDQSSAVADTSRKDDSQRQTGQNEPGIVTFCRTHTC